MTSQIFSRAESAESLLAWNDERSRLLQYVLEVGAIAVDDTDFIVTLIYILGGAVRRGDPGGLPAVTRALEMVVSGKSRNL